MRVSLPFYSIITYIPMYVHIGTRAWAHICVHKEGKKNYVHEHQYEWIYTCSRALKMYIGVTASDDFIWKQQCPPRLEMTGFREVQRQIENYGPPFTFNFTPRQNKLKVVSLKHSLSVVWHTEQHKSCMPLENQKSFPGSHKKNVSPPAFPWGECSHGLHAKER